MIPINRPFLPPKLEYAKYLDKIWDSCWLTNNGNLLRTLETKISERIENKNLLYVANGTLALQLAIAELDREDDRSEIITTPFSFIATTSAIVWQHFTPVYCDINESTLNIDVDKIERLITKNTKAILATHVYGNPCDIRTIEKIAKKHNLKVIYDGAHAFDVNFEGRSIFNYGDVSVCSLHATKYYHSTEGGLIVCNTEGLYDRFNHMRNFGFDNHYKFADVGINAKNSEFHAAMGLTNLKYLDQIKEKRCQISERYDALLRDIPIRKPEWNSSATKNYGYYPIIFESENDLLNAIDTLEKNKIFPRRYFYPALNEGVPYVHCKQPTPVCKDLSKKVLCLPLYFDLSFEEVDMVCEHLVSIFSKKLVRA